MLRKEISKVKYSIPLWDIKNLHVPRVLGTGETDSWHTQTHSWLHTQLLLPALSWLSQDCEGDKPLPQRAQCTPFPFLPLPFFIYSDSLLSVLHNLRWILIIEAVSTMLPLCHAYSLFLLKISSSGRRWITLPQHGRWHTVVSRSLRRILSHHRQYQRESGC